MRIITETLHFESKGNCNMLNITDDVQNVILKNKFTNGNVIVFVVGSTASVSTIEYEPGLIKDLPEMLEKIIPQNKKYHHNDTWGDYNGHSHLRASTIGPSITVPFKNGEMMLGTWQQIVLIDFDNRARKRKIVVQVCGE